MGGGGGTGKGNWVCCKVASGPQMSLYMRIYHTRQFCIWGIIYKNWNHQGQSKNLCLINNNARQIADWTMWTPFLPIVFIFIIILHWNKYVFYFCCSVYTWSETYFRQDLFLSYLFFKRQFHAIVIFRLKSISNLDSGSLPRFFWWIHIRKIYNRGVITTTGREIAKTSLTSG